MGPPCQSGRVAYTGARAGCGAGVAGISECPSGDAAALTGRGGGGKWGRPWNVPPPIPPSVTPAPGPSRRRRRWPTGPRWRPRGRRLFETGYGPSGLPHIGTFGEVARTTWVRRAFERLTGLPSRLLAFSDDMDALRKVPDNVPQRGDAAGASRAGR